MLAGLMARVLGDAPDEDDDGGGEVGCAAHEVSPAPRHSVVVRQTMSCRTSL